MSHLFEVVVEIQELRPRWENPALADQATLVLRSARLLADLHMLISHRELDKEVKDATAGFLQAESEILTENAHEVLSEVLDSGEAAALRSHLEEIRADFVQIVKRVQDMSKRLSIFNAATELIEVPSPHTLDVPVDDLQDTLMDLPRVRLVPGDEIVFRAALKEGDKEIERTAASFKVKRLGWYAELSPAVVLVKPAELEGGSDDFRFAPALSWLHHYVPRPEEDEWYTALLRTLEPAIGLHSIFTNFEPEGGGEAIQVGLGITLSFWRGRLQFGSGYNLMADSDDEGRYYLFVGTDLIGLLQTLGLDR